jgi:hypothetical protein
MLVCGQTLIQEAIRVDMNKIYRLFLIGMALKRLISTSLGMSYLHDYKGLNKILIASYLTISQDDSSVFGHLSAIHELHCSRDITR